MEKNLLDKLWNSHVVLGEIGQPQLLYVDLHLIHEVTSPQAFEGIQAAKRSVRRPDKTFATMDHNVPTQNIYQITDQVAKKQIDTLRQNCQKHRIELCDNGSVEQGIVHLVGPEMGLTQPGKLIVCGDSHTATHGAFGALAFGIGTSEVEHVFATQCIWQTKPKAMGIEITGKLMPGVTAKDIILAIIAKYGVDFGVGYGCEFFGEAVTALSMEERMTLCNMAIEGGAKIGFIAPDEKTWTYLANRPYAPKDISHAKHYWEKLQTNFSVESVFDKEIKFDVSKLAPYITWGTNPAMGVSILEKFPSINDENDQRAYKYMGLMPESKGTEIKIDYVFIGSCTNGRLSDLIAAAKIIKGRKVAKNVIALVVPGSRKVKLAAEKIGLDHLFKEAGFQWREPGCSMCLAMNPDQVPSGAHCASTSNRNFEGRQGKGARTHLCSPEMAAAAAIYGHFVDVREEV